MKRTFNMLAMLVILMAGFMSVCMAHENCALEKAHSFSHAESALDSKPQGEQGHCGLTCHVAPHNIPQTVSNVFNAPVFAEERTLSVFTLISLGLYTVLDQPPRA